MAVLVGRTLRQLRASVLYNCGALYEGTTTSAGTTSDLIDNNLALGDTGDLRGRYIWITASTNANAVRRVQDSTPTGLKLLPALSSATASGDTYQLIGKAGFSLRPETVNEFIRQAIMEVTGLAYDPEESLALHGDGRQRRFDVPSEFKMLSGVWTRQSVESTQIHDATSDWDEATVANVTRTVDTQHYKRAGGSVKMVVAAGASAGLVLASKAISSLNLSKYDYAEFWIESTVATAAGDLQLLLDDTALCVSPVETLSVPALVANTPTYCRVALANPALDTAIISVGLKYTVDIGACTVWVNDVKGVLDWTATWVPMDRNNWYVDEEARDLVFRHAPPYRLMKITGGDAPLLLSSDSDTNEVDDSYVIARATELTLLAAGGGPSTDPDALRSLASYWGNRAGEAKRSFPWLEGVRPS